MNIFFLLVLFLEFRIVVAREAHRGLRQIVGAEGEELRRARHAIRRQSGARDLDPLFVKGSPDLPIYGESAAAGSEILYGFQPEQQLRALARTVRP